MSQQHQTREKIHSGLSVQQDDTKWRSMLNFRSAYQSTRAVPFKKKLLSVQTGLHSLINGLSNWFYTIGENSSHVLTGSDNLLSNPLWRGNVEVLVKNKPRLFGEQKLLVRGAYTGSGPQRIRVSISKGQLHTYVVPTEPEEVLEPEISVDCGLGEKNVVRVAAASEEDSLWSLLGSTTDSRPIPNPSVRVLYGRFIRAEGQGNGAGLFDFDSSPGVVTVDVSATGFQPERLVYTVEEFEELQVVPVNLKMSIVDWKLVFRATYRDEEGVDGPNPINNVFAACDIVLNELHIDRVTIPEVVRDGPEVMTEYVFTEERVEEWITRLGGTLDRLELEFTTLNSTGDVTLDPSIEIELIPTFAIPDGDRWTTYEYGTFRFDVL